MDGTLSQLLSDYYLKCQAIVSYQQREQELIAGLRERDAVIEKLTKQRPALVPVNQVEDDDGGVPSTG